MTTERELALIAVGWAGWMVIGLALGAALERRAPWTGGLTSSAALLAVELAIARGAAWLGPAPRHHGVARVALAVVALDLAQYAAHRAMHRVPWLWRFHRLHHRPGPLRWHHAWRRHPVDEVGFALAAAAVIGAVGASPHVAAAVVIARRAWTVALHAEVAWPASRLDRWLATPAFHRRHHDEAAPPGNYASTLAVIDRLLGTAVAPRRYRSPAATSAGSGCSFHTRSISSWAP